MSKFTWTQADRPPDIETIESTVSDWHSSLADRIRWWRGDLAYSAPEEVGKNYTVRMLDDIANHAVRSFEEQEFTARTNERDAVCEMVQHVCESVMRRYPTVPAVEAVKCVSAAIGNLPFGDIALGDDGEWVPVVAVDE